MFTFLSRLLKRKRSTRRDKQIESAAVRTPRSHRSILAALADDPRSIPAGALNEARLGRRLNENLITLSTLCGDAPDFIVRRIAITESQEAAVVFYDTLGRSELVASQVLHPIHERAEEGFDEASVHLDTLEKAVRSRFVNTARLQTQTFMGKLFQGLAEGKAALLVDGSATALMIDLIGYDKRAVDEPDSEPVVRGPRDGFIEDLHTNLSLIRRRIGTPLLRFEMRHLGEWTQTGVVMAYIHGLAPEGLVAEARGRLDQIEIDGVIDSGYLEEFIEDTPYTVFPQMQITERPDTVSASLLEGRIAILSNGSPFALVVPTTLWNLMNASEDYYQRFDGASFVRILRYLLVSLVVLLPSIYVAATTFHPEMLPGSMLLSIAAAREAVPFSSFTEVFLMEITFEALREAGVRLPRPVGQTIGIVGAIVLGEAAVQAQLVSAPVVIIVAFTGISSFVIPHFNLGLAIRMVRFPILILAGTLGLFGIAMGLLLLVLHLVTLRSFGLPYLSPLSPLRPEELRDAVLRAPWWRMLRRPRMPGGKATWREGFPLMPHPDLSKGEEALRDAPKQT